MRLQFYGTSGAEGIPSAFCHCPVCENARVSGGKELRLRSMLRAGRSTLIDAGPDIHAAAYAHGDLSHIQHLLITHTHEDHFYYGFIETRALSVTDQAPLTVYLTDRAFDIVHLLDQNQGIMRGSLLKTADKTGLNFKRLNFFEETLLDSMAVIPLPGNHNGNMGENSANYFVTLDDGKTLYYAVDTGWFLPEALELLKNKQLDILITECTHSGNFSRADKPGFHLDFKSCLSLFKELLAIKAITENTQIYLTHISHKGGLNHMELSKMAADTDFPCPINIAWDGLSIYL